ncbi:hypothetical protein WN943_016926 [Citrus x changshan-huyou]
MQGWCPGQPQEELEEGLGDQHRCADNPGDFLASRVHNVFYFLSLPFGNSKRHYQCIKTNAMENGFHLYMCGAWKMLIEQEKLNPTKEKQILGLDN